MSRNICLEPIVNAYGASIAKAEAGNTFSKASTDAAQGLSELELVNDDGLLPSSIYVSASDADIRYAFNDGNGTDPDQSGFGFVLAVDGDFKEVQGWDFISRFKFASAADATPGTLIIECEY